MTDIYILDEDEFYLKSIKSFLEKKGFDVLTNSNWDEAIVDLKKHKPKNVVLQRKNQSLRKSIIVQMSEELLMTDCTIFLSNDLPLDELDQMLAQSLGFENVIHRPLTEEDVSTFKTKHSEEDLAKAA